MADEMVELMFQALDGGNGYNAAVRRGKKPLRAKSEAHGNKIGDLVAIHGDRSATIVLHSTNRKVNVKFSDWTVVGVRRWV